MVCSHCHQVGHTYRTCPTMTEEEKKAKAEEIKKKKEERTQRTEQRRQREAERQRIQTELERRRSLPTSKINISNPTEYEIVIYWAFSNPDIDGQNNIASVFSYCGAHTSVQIKCKKAIHRLIMIPFLEVTVPGRVDALQTITLHENGEIPQQTVFDMKMEEYDGTEIIIDQEYNPPKSEIDLWKECALKSKFLLDQIYTLTGGVDKDGNVSKEEFENIAPMLDMIQDISIPMACTEIDKERAGVPSGLTNIT
jgi:hypothetical protein